MKFVPLVVGIVCVVVAARDIVATLFYPQGHGTFSPALSRLVWRLARRNQRTIGIAGPSIVLVVIASWVLLIAIGWALIYWPFLPESFRYDSGVSPADRTGLLAAVYLSLVSLATLGFGDISPTAGWLRVLVPLEALVGFGILTASLSWTLSLFPILSGRRTLAVRISLLDQTEAISRLSVEDLDPSFAANLLAGLTGDVIRARDDLVHFPISYYFQSENPDTALPAQIGKLVGLGVRGTHSRSDSVCFQAVALMHALNSFSNVLAENFPGCTAHSTGEVLQAYARDHRHSDVVASSPDDAMDQYQASSVSPDRSSRIDRGIR